MRKGLFTGILVAALFVGYFVAPGTFKNGAAAVTDYTVSADGTEITLELAVSDGLGALRKAAVSQQQGGKLYVDCYRAFGGFHGTIGAKDRFTLPLAADTESIALYRNENAYQTVLEKDAAGNWLRVTE